MFFERKAFLYDVERVCVQIFLVVFTVVFAPLGITQLEE
jgi:hypothetical protein